MKIEKSSQDLENEVIYADLCIHCGSCNAFCPHTLLMNVLRL
ncbi:MAG: 4Fe-4S binding protein [Promethearchaeota archaeon]